MRSLLQTLLITLRPPTVRRMPVMVTPTAYELEYFVALVNALSDTERRAWAALLRRQRYDTWGPRVDGADEELDEELTKARKEEEEERSSRWWYLLALPFFVGTERLHHAQIEQSLKARFGNPNLPKLTGNEAWLQPEMNRAVRENVEFIRTLPNTLLDQVAKKVGEVMSKGGDQRALEKALHDAVGVSHRRARILARDQLHKWYGRLNEIRQRDLGITHYVWRTQRDPLVRDGHEKREGVVFSWDEVPPDVGGGEGHPGTPVNCRCYAQPLIRRR